MTTKEKLLTIKEVCSKTLSMNIKESYLSNLDILEKSYPLGSGQFKKLSVAIEENCSGDCYGESGSPEEVSKDVLGYDLFNLDRYDIFTISYDYAKKILLGIYDEIFISDPDTFSKLANLQKLVENAFDTDQRCKNRFKNKRYYSKLFMDFLTSRRDHYIKINDEIDMLILEME